MKTYLVKVERHEETITHIYYKVCANSKEEADREFSEHPVDYPEYSTERPICIDCSDEVIGVEELKDE